MRMMVRDSLREAIAEEMRRDDGVFVIGEEVSQFSGVPKVTQGLAQEFGPGRVIDVPATEAGFVGLAVGAAMAGLKPVVEFMTFNFALQALDQIVNSAAKLQYMSGGTIRCPIVLRGPNGATARVGAQHAQDYAAWFAHVPGLKVVMPFTAADHKGLLKAAIRDPGPVIFLESERLYPESFAMTADDDPIVPIGQARVARDGQDVTIVAFGVGMLHALAAAESLAIEGIEAEIIDLRTLRPLDIATVLASVAKTNRCILVEEGWPQAGISADISARIMERGFDDLDAPVLRVTGADVPMPYAASLQRLALPTADDVIAAARAVLYR